MRRGTGGRFGRCDTQRARPSPLVAGATIMLLAIAAGCSSSTKMVRSWTTPDFHGGTVTKVFVLGVSPDGSLRRLYEDTFVADLKKRGHDAEAGYMRVPDPAKADHDAVAAGLRKDGFSHVLVSRVVDIENRETYHPPTSVVVGVGGYPGYYGGWYPYMSMSYGYVTSPGYTTVNKIVSLETNLYDLGTEKLIWSGMTQTWLEDSPEKQIGPVIDAVVWDLRSKGVL